MLIPSFINAFHLHIFPHALIPYFIFGYTQFTSLHSTLTSTLSTRTHHASNFYIACTLFLYCNWSLHCCVLLTNAKSARTRCALSRIHNFGTHSPQHDFTVFVPLIFTVSESKTRIRDIRKQSISLVLPGVIVYMSLRHFSPYWYDTLSLDDLYHVQYVIRMCYTNLINSKHKSIRASIPVFDFTTPPLDNYFVTFYGQRTTIPQGAVLVDEAFLHAHPFVQPPPDILSKFHRKP